MTSSDFLGRFDEDGRLDDGDGKIEVTFAPKGRTELLPGSLHFKKGKLIRLDLQGQSSWGDPGETPINKLRFVLSFDDAPWMFWFDTGRIVEHAKVPFDFPGYEDA